MQQSRGLHQNAWLNDLAFSSPEVAAEAENAGLKLLAPVMTPGQYAFSCADPVMKLSDVNGKQVSVSSAQGGAVAESLGATPVTVPFTDLFESLERGIIDCSVIGLTTLDKSSALALVPHVLYDDEHAFPYTPSALTMGKAKWDSLPLLAQQLIWDRVVDQFFATLIGSEVVDGTGDAIASADAAGGGLVPMSADIRDAFEELADEKLVQLKSSTAVADAQGFMANAEEIASKWRAIITEDLGYEDPDVAEYAEVLGAGVDLGPYLDRLYEELWQQHRPS